MTLQAKWIQQEYDNQNDSVTKFNSDVNLVNDILYGDINLDGKVNMKDLTRAHQYVEGIVELDEQAKLQADVLKDGRINTFDLIVLYSYVSNIITELPYIY